MTYPTKDSHPELFVHETRTLRDEHGMDRIVTMAKISWSSYEWMLRESSFTEQDLLAIGDEEAQLRGITFAEYFPKGLACMVHYFEQRPHLMTSNKKNGELAGYIGPSSKLQIKELDQKLNDTK